MASVQDGLNTQVRNIEARYAKSMDEWAALIAASGKSKHTDVIAMLQPASAWVDVGLILRGALAAARLEPAAQSDAMFGHRVRIATEADVDDEFIAWLTEAYSQAG